MYELGQLVGFLVPRDVPVNGEPPEGKVLARVQMKCFFFSVPPSNLKKVYAGIGRATFSISGSFTCDCGYNSDLELNAWSYREYILPPSMLSADVGTVLADFQHTIALTLKLLKLFSL